MDALYLPVTLPLNHTRPFPQIYDNNVQVVKIVQQAITLKSSGGYHKASMKKVICVKESK